MFIERQLAVNVLFPGCKRDVNIVSTLCLHGQAEFTSKLTGPAETLGELGKLLPGRAGGVCESFRCFLELIAPTADILWVPSRKHHVCDTDTSEPAGALHYCSTGMLPSSPYPRLLFPVYVRTPQVVH